MARKLKAVVNPIDEAVALEGVLEGARKATGNTNSRAPHDVEFVEQDRCLWRMRGRRFAKRLPQVHHCKAHPSRLLRPQLGVELRHAGLGAIDATEPDRLAADQIAHHDTVPCTP